MSLKIHSVINSNDPAKEFVALTTTEKINLKNYAIVDKTFDEDGKISNEFRHIYIFPDFDLNPKEWIYLYTGTGKNYTGKNMNDQKVHVLYWNANECVWNDQGGDKATLIRFAVVNSVEVPPIAKK